MMRCIDHPPRRRQGRKGLCEGAANRITPGGFHTKECSADIRDDTRGTPSAFRPWTNCRPQRGRYAHEENARVFHQGPDMCVVHREAGYIHAALFLHGSSRDTPSLHRRLGPYINLCCLSSIEAKFLSPSLITITDKLLILHEEVGQLRNMEPSGKQPISQTRKQ